MAVRARSEADVQTVVRVARNWVCRWFPAVRGPPVRRRERGGRLIVLDVSRMKQIVEIDTDNLICVVEPGIVNNDLKAELAEHGLWYPPDPASAPWSTIGGNVATNAGGLCCLKYGVTRDYVLGLRAVTGTVPGAAGTAHVGRSVTATSSGWDGAPPRAWPGST